MNELMNKPLKEWTEEELNKAGFEAYQNREIARIQAEEVTRAINIINQEVQRRKEAAEPIKKGK